MNRDPITVDDVIAAGGCGNGIRDWFVAVVDDLPEWYRTPGNGLRVSARMSPAHIAIRRFREQGLPCDIAEPMNDALVNRVLSHREKIRGR